MLDADLADVKDLGVSSDDDDETEGYRDDDGDDVDEDKDTNGSSDCTSLEDDTRFVVLGQ